MNRKILTLAVAATLAGPTAVYADIKVSGLIQAEAASWEGASDVEDVKISGLEFDEIDNNDRQILTNDVSGAIFNEGPNAISFHIDEKLGSGVSAFALYSTSFDTSGNRGLLGQSDAWLGLKTRNFYIKYGTITGAYKSSRDLVDPWAFTSLQATGTAGGMSGATYHKVNPILKTVDIGASTESNGLANEGFVDGALELGVKFGGFTARLQGVVDDRSAMDGAGLLELRYSAPNFAMWLAGSFTDLGEGLEDIKDEATADLDDALGDINETIGRDEAAEENREAAAEARQRANQDESLGNWKIGGKFNLGPMVTLGLQYEDAEIGTFDWNINPKGGKYILGSLAVNMSNVTLAGWVSGYLSDIDENDRLIDINGEAIDEDALSWAVGAKYHFSKRAQLYLGYRQTDSDNDYRDENVITLGIRHSF